MRNFLDRRYSLLQQMQMVAVLCLLLVAFLTHNAFAVGATGLVGVGFGGMITDAQCTLSDAQALTVTAYSTNTFDTLLAGNNIAAGEPLAIMFTVDVAAKLSDADETYQFGVIQSANANLSSEDVLIQTTTAFLTKAVLVAGYKFALPIPPHSKTKRYLGVKYTLGGTNPAVTVTSSIVPLAFVQNDIVYPKNFTISS